MIIQFKQLKDVEITEDRGTEDKTIRIIEKNGSFYGALTEIKIPAESYELFEKAIMEIWLEKKKSIY